MGKTLPKVAIIGAGSSGMVACKELKERNIPYDCFEKGSQAGGNWIFKNDNGVSAAYRSLHINTSRKQMEFKCFPMSDDLPYFPSHEHIAKYFDDFMEHFRLKPTITFNCEVKKIEPLPNGSWHLELANGEQRTYDAVIVANGHHWDPRLPDPGYPGHFSGISMHSHSYLDPCEPHNLIDKNVVILGMGNSAMDIACELGRRGVARKVFLAARSGVHIMPKFFGGTPADAFLRHPGDAPHWWEYIVPYSLFERLGFAVVARKIRQTVGIPQELGLLKPKHRFGMAHPTISSEIHIRVGSGDVIPKPNIQELMGDQVRFADGSVEKVDAIVYATGYNISFPFLDKKILSFRSNDLALFKRMVNPQYPNLLFIGLVQPLCSIMPVAEQQARFMGEYLLGHYQLPDKSTMEKTMRAEHEDMKSRYVKSESHTIQINCLEYTFDLRREMKRGQNRAKKQGETVPLAARPFPNPVGV